MGGGGGMGRTWGGVKAIAGNRSPLAVFRGGPVLRNGVTGSCPDCDSQRTIEMYAYFVGKEQNLLIFGTGVIPLCYKYSNIKYRPSTQL